MNATAERRLGIVWLALSAISALSYLIGASREQDAFRPDAAITFGVILIALVKVRVIVREFMEVRHAPVLLGRLTDIWLSLTGVALLGTYLVGALSA